MDVPVVVSRRAGAFLGRQVCDGLRQQILAGRLQAGARLPSTRELARALGVARTTVGAAYDQLTAEGYIEARPGSGTFVSAALPARPVPARSGSRPPRQADFPMSRYAGRLAAAGGEAAPPQPGLARSLAAADPFPYAIWHRALRRQLRRGRTGGAPTADATAGHPELRAAIAAYLGRRRAVTCDPDRIVVVGGSQQALDLCARVLVDAGSAVAVEDPGYADARRVFAAAGARVCPVPVDAEGLVVADIPADVRVAHVTPSHQYPTGAVLSLARRLELLAWAREVRGVVIEDDYDSEFRYDAAPLPSLQGLLAPSRVVYVGTFSTAMFAGLRLGYLVPPDELVEPILRAKWYASRHTPDLEQAALAAFIQEGHFERHLRRARRLYRRRRDALVAALDRVFGRAAVVSGQGAGLHLVVRFADPRVARAAEAEADWMSPTRPCYAGRAVPREFIVRFSRIDERAIDAAVRRMATRLSRSPGRAPAGAGFP